MKTLKILTPLLFLAGSFAMHAEDFTYTTNVDQITITGYIGTNADVVVPDTINGLPVTGIGDYAFFGCSSPTNIMIGTNITSLGFGVFDTCTNLVTISVATDNDVYSSLEGVLFDISQTALIAFPEGKTGSYTIPGGVTSIGEDAFSTCTHLTDVTISSTVTSIGNYAFWGCSGLTALTIPDGVASIGTWVFPYCTSLTNIIVGAGNTAYAGVDGVLFDLGQDTLIQYPAGKPEGAYTVPGGVTNIADGAFESCVSLTNVATSDSVARIGNGAFVDCPNLKSVTISNGVTSLGDSAFTACATLAAVHFLGNAPTNGLGILNGNVFVDSAPTVYYVIGTSGWTNPWLGRPTVPTSVVPYILSQSTSQSTGIGYNVALTAQVIGLDPLVYQWRQNGTNLSDLGNLSGALSNTLAITDVQSSNAGNYDLIITNGYGSVTSAVIVLTVNLCPPVMLGDVTNAFKKVKYLCPVSVTPAGNYTFTNVSGALPVGLTLTNSNGKIGGTAKVYGIYSFTLMASNNATGCIGTRSYTMLVNSSVPDGKAPTVVINNPKKNAVVMTAPPIIVDGTVKDAVLVTNVEVNLDAAGWTAPTAQSATSFSLSIASLTPGLHWVSVRATDLSGNTCTPVSRSFHYGTHSFVNQGGIYYGLFGGPSTSVESSGFAKVTVTAKPGKLPTFSAVLSIAGKSPISAAGKFELDGNGSLNTGAMDISTKIPGHGQLWIDLAIPLVDDAKTMTGSIQSTVPSWTSTLTANLSVTNQSVINPETLKVTTVKSPVAGTDYDGLYTLVLPAFDSTIGDGYASLTIDNGTIKATGKLADGQAFSQSGLSVGPNGEWPLFVSNDKNGTPALYHSILTGWASAADVDNGTNTGLVWIKGANQATYGPAGFTHDATLEGSTYGGDPGAALVLPLTFVDATSAAGNVYLNDGDLGTNIVNAITLTNTGTKNKFISGLVATKANKWYSLSLTLTPKTGVLAGSFKAVGNGVDSGTIAGIVMTNQFMGRGYQMEKAGGTVSGAFSVH